MEWPVNVCTFPPLFDLLQTFTENYHNILKQPQGESRKNIEKHGKTGENVEKHEKTGRIRGKHRKTRKNMRKQGETEKHGKTGRIRGKHRKTRENNG